MKIKVAIVGTGFSATSHLEALRRVPNVEVFAVVSRSLEMANHFAKKYGIPHSYDDVDAVLKNEEIAVVHNCTPNYLHYAINKKALEAGKHVLSEKPLAISSEETEELLEIAKKQQRIHGVCFNYRFYPLVQEMKTRVQNKDRVYLIHGGYIQDWLLYPTDYSWRLEKAVNGESRAIADIGSHFCDTIQYILGKKITRVFADLHTIHSTRKKPTDEVQTFATAESQNYEEVAIDTEDVGHVLLHFEGGTSGAFTVSQVSAGRKNHFHFEISTENATFSWNQEKPNELWIGKRDEPNGILLRDPSLLSEKSRSFVHYPGGHEEGWPDALKNLFIDFYGHIQNPEKDTFEYATFEDGHRIMKIIEAVLKSHETKQWVSIE